VQNAAAMGVLEREGDLHERREQAAERILRHGLGLVERELAEHRLEALPAEPLHREEEPLLLGQAEIVDRHDRGVLELALHARLPQEPVAGELLDLGTHRLDRDVATDDLVAREPNLAHPALAEQAARLIASGERGRPWRLVVGSLGKRLGAAQREQAPKRDRRRGVLVEHLGLQRATRPRCTARRRHHLGLRGLEVPVLHRVSV